jgi:hypothetical protein
MSIKTRGTYLRWKLRRHFHGLQGGKLHRRVILGRSGNPCHSFCDCGRLPSEPVSIFRLEWFPATNSTTSSVDLSGSFFLNIFGLVHHTHPAAAQLLEDAVMGDGLADHRLEIFGPQALSQSENDIGRMP